MKKEKQSQNTSGKRNLRNRSGSKKNVELLRTSKATDTPTHTNGKKMEVAVLQNSELTYNLSPFEVTVMQRISNGAENIQLAKDYNTTTDAIEWHRKQLIKKLGAAHFTHAVAIGLRKK